MLDGRGRPRRAGGRPLPRGRAASAATCAHTLAMPCWQCMHCRRRARTHMRCSSSRLCWTSSTDRCRTRHPLFLQPRDHMTSKWHGPRRWRQWASSMPPMLPVSPPFPWQIQGHNQPALLRVCMPWLKARALIGKLVKKGRGPWRHKLTPEPRAARRRRTASEPTRGVATSGKGWGRCGVRASRATDTHCSPQCAASRTRGAHKAVGTLSYSRVTLQPRVVRPE